MNGEKAKDKLDLTDANLRTFVSSGRGRLSELGGSFVSLFNEDIYIYGSDGIVELLVESEAFKDERTYYGEKIRFDKRAQLAVCMIYEKCLHTMYEFEICDESSFTIFADYGIPAGLAAYNVFEYEDSLQKQIDNNIQIEENSKEEVEIRAATVLAGELIQEEIKNETGVTVSMVVLDYLLWQMRNDAETSLLFCHIPILTGLFPNLDNLTINLFNSPSSGNRSTIRPEPEPMYS